MIIMTKLSHFFLFLFLFVAFCSGLSAQEAQTVYSANEHPDMLPELSKKGESAIGVKTLTLENNDYVDPFTGERAPRSLKVEVWYPTDETGATDAIYANQTRNGISFQIKGDAIRDAQVSAPQELSLVILSHGYTGYRTIMYYIGEHLASHGYVVVSIDHTDSTNEDVDPKVNPFSGFKSTLINRSRDQQYILEYFSNTTNTTKVFGESLSVKNAGIIGYSMGGYGAINTIGGCYDFNDEFVMRMIFSNDEEKIKAAQAAFNTCAAGQSREDFTVDPRWKAMISFAPWGGEAGVFPDSYLNKIKVPSLYLSLIHI